jgi:hypothetical protein
MRFEQVLSGLDRRQRFALVVGAGSDRVRIEASAERWEACLAELLTGRVANPSEVARSMFVRGEIGVEEFERVVDVGA